VAKKSKATSLADQYGFSRAFFSSDPALSAILAQAVKGNWTTDKFIAEFRDTKWFKTHGATYRQNLAQKTGDPATWNTRLSQTIASLQDQAHKVGANLTASQLHTLADHALLSGYTDSQLQNSLGSYVSMQGGQYFGDANTNAMNLQQVAWRNGIKIAPGTLQNWVQQIAKGNHTPEDFSTYARNMASTLAPGFSDQLKGGQDLYDLASPYMQQMASTLEVPATDLDLFDPTIRNALNFKGVDGKVTSQTMGDFEQSLRNDPRYMKTQGAQDAFSSTAHNILSAFGFSS
jgi:hypothetical protein